MRLIKMFLFVMFGLAVMLTLIGLVIPSSVKISRGIIVNADSIKVYQQLSDVKDWGKWMPWVTADEGALVQTSPVTNIPGSYFKWKGLNLKNNGTISFLTISPNYITTKYELQGMNDSEGGFRIRSIPNNLSQTEVQWFMEYKLKWYPWERFYGIFIDHIIGPSFDKGLQELKLYLEQEQTVNG
ncbi:MAG: SRPBCC family protein [Chitinophagaceae bacterium]|nr:SRPBCC family protein [Chitinophagaceae bacterium]